jgi:hypothetical protein
MGMIPIALALAGFVLLWVIVNYNSLATGRANIASLQSAREQLLRTYISLAGQLSALLRIYGVDTPSYLVNLANEPGQKIDSMNLRKSLEQVVVQVRNRADLSDNPDYSGLMQQMEITTGQLLKNQQSLLSAIKGYNGQVTHMPYRIVAQLFGFRKSTSPIV